MSLVNYATREITCKIVYYGPGRSGKTTNLHYIYGQVPADRKGQMVSLATQTDRTLFFDFLPIDLGTISGFTTRFQLYTVPGQVYYQTTRRLVLQGADGVVFVADSQSRQLEGKPFSALHYTGKDRQIFLGAIPAQGVTLVLLAVFDRESSLGLVQLFLEEFKARVAAAPAVSPDQPPALAENFERDLNRNLAQLFGRA